MPRELLVVLGGYLIGSMPSAAIVVRWLGRGNIRRLGDGNMGARNVARQIGWAPGMLVGVLDFGKGVAALWAAQQEGLAGFWLLVIGAACVAGHDFPVWAGFRGGQGMATSLGVLTWLMPGPTVLGLAAFGLAYLITRFFDISAALGLALVVVLGWRQREPASLVLYAAALFVSIGLKKALDRPRRRALHDHPVEEIRPGPAR